MVHLVRNSVEYVSKKDVQSITKAKREIYTASTIDVAAARLEQFSTD